MSTPIDMQSVRTRRGAGVPDDARPIPDNTLAPSDDAAKRALRGAHEEYGRAIVAVHDLHRAYLNDACDLTEADCAALRRAHHAWVAAAAAVQAASGERPVSADAFDAAFADDPF